MVGQDPTGDQDRDNALWEAAVGQRQSQGPMAPEAAEQFKAFTGREASGDPRVDKAIWDEAYRVKFREATGQDPTGDADRDSALWKSAQDEQFRQATGQEPTGDADRDAEIWSQSTQGDRAGMAEKFREYTGKEMTGDPQQDQALWDAAYGTRFYEYTGQRTTGDADQDQAIWQETHRRKFADFTGEEPTGNSGQDKATWDRAYRTKFRELVGRDPSGVREADDAAYNQAATEQQEQWVEKFEEVTGALSTGDMARDRQVWEESQRHRFREFTGQDMTGDQAQDEQVWQEAVGSKMDENRGWYDDVVRRAVALAREHAKAYDPSAVTGSEIYREVQYFLERPPHGGLIDTSSLKQYVDDVVSEAAERQALVEKFRPYFGSYVDIRKIQRAQSLLEQNAGEDGTVDESPEALRAAYQRAHYSVEQSRDRDSWRARRERRRERRLKAINDAREDAGQDPFESYDDYQSARREASAAQERFIRDAVDSDDDGRISHSEHQAAFRQGIGNFGSGYQIFDADKARDLIFRETHEGSGAPGDPFREKGMPTIAEVSAMYDALKEVGIPVQDKTSVEITDLARENWDTLQDHFQRDVGSAGLTDAQRSQFQTDLQDAIRGDLRPEQFEARYTGWTLQDGTPVTDYLQQQREGFLGDVSTALTFLEQRGWETDGLSNQQALDEYNRLNRAQSVMELNDQVRRAIREDLSPGEMNALFGDRTLSDGTPLTEFIATEKERIRRDTALDRLGQRRVFFDDDIEPRTEDLELRLGNLEGQLERERRNYLLDELGKRGVFFDDDIEPRTQDLEVRLTNLAGQLSREHHARLLDALGREGVFFDDDREPATEILQQRLANIYDEKGRQHRANLLDALGREGVFFDDDREPTTDLLQQRLENIYTQKERERRATLLDALGREGRFYDDDIEPPTEVLYQRISNIYEQKERERREQLIAALEQEGRFYDDLDHIPSNSVLYQRLSNIYAQNERELRAELLTALEQEGRFYDDLDHIPSTEVLQGRLTNILAQKEREKLEPAVLVPQAQALGVYDAADSPEEMLNKVESEKAKLAWQWAKAKAEGPESTQAQTLMNQSAQAVQNAIAAYYVARTQYEERQHEYLADSSEYAASATPFDETPLGMSLISDIMEKTGENIAVHEELGWTDSKGRTASQVFDEDMGDIEGLIGENSLQEKLDAPLIGSIADTSVGDLLSGLTPTEYARTWADIQANPFANEFSHKAQLQVAGFGDSIWLPSMLLGMGIGSGLIKYVGKALAIKSIQGLGQAVTRSVAPRLPPRLRLIGGRVGPGAVRGGVYETGSTLPDFGELYAAQYVAGGSAGDVTGRDIRGLLVGNVASSAAFNTPVKAAYQTAKVVPKMGSQLGIFTSGGRLGTARLKTNDIVEAGLNSFQDKALVQPVRRQDLGFEPEPVPEKRAAVGLILKDLNTPDPKVLLNQRSYSYRQGYYTGVGGLVDPILDNQGRVVGREDPMLSFTREAKEETGGGHGAPASKGADVRVIGKMWEDTYSPISYFVAEYQGGELSPQKGESLGLEWVSLKDIDPATLAYAYDRMAIANMDQRLQQKRPLNIDEWEFGVQKAEREFDAARPGGVHDLPKGPLGTSHGGQVSSMQVIREQGVDMNKVFADLGSTYGRYGGIKHFRVGEESGIAIEHDPSLQQRSFLKHFSGTSTLLPLLQSGRYRRAEGRQQDVEDMPYLDPLGVAAGYATKVNPYTAANPASAGFAAVDPSFTEPSFSAAAKGRDLEAEVVVRDPEAAFAGRPVVAVERIGTPNRKLSSAGMVFFDMPGHADLEGPWRGGGALTGRQRFGANLRSFTHPLFRTQPAGLVVSRGDQYSPAEVQTMQQRAEKGRDWEYAKHDVSGTTPPLTEAERTRIVKERMQRIFPMAEQYANIPYSTVSGGLLPIPADFFTRYRPDLREAWHTLSRDPRISEGVEYGPSTLASGIAMRSPEAREAFYQASIEHRRRDNVDLDDTFDFQWDPEANTWRTGRDADDVGFYGLRPDEPTGGIRTGTDLDPNFATGGVDVWDYATRGDFPDRFESRGDLSGRQEGEPPVDAPLEPPPDAPLEPPVDVPLEPPVDAPLEPPPDVPVEPPLDVPVEPPPDVPVEPPPDVPVEPPPDVPVAVSYTHLTLPTIYSV